MKWVKNAFVAWLMCGQAGTAWALPWDKDMVDEPSAKPQEAIAPPLPNAVPVTGGGVVPSHPR